MSKRIYSVGQVTQYIRNLFARDGFLGGILISGEVSNCKYHSSGHIYFSLKDEKSSIACVMFAGSRKGLAFSMKDGDKVVVSGNIDIYERDGRYQLYAASIRKEGTGDLYEKFLALKKELEEEGMFDNSFKQPIPEYAMRVGVVTAPTGAAIRDIQNISRRRNPYVQVILYPALVQGEGAAASIIRGLRAMDHAGVDVIILGRGGGSYEDLQAFNEESVARAVFACRTPVISAVGHETDTTITDFAADLRAPTPSAAAELAVFDLHAFHDRIFRMRQRLLGGVHARNTAAYAKCRWYEAKLASLSPEARLKDQRHAQAEYTRRLEDSMLLKINSANDRLGLLSEKLKRLAFESLRKNLVRQQMTAARLKGLNPIDRLRQGYSYICDDSGRTVSSVKSVHINNRLKIYVSDGIIRAEVIETDERKHSDT